MACGRCRRCFDIRPELCGMDAVLGWLQGIITSCSKTCCEIIFMCFGRCRGIFAVLYVPCLVGWCYCITPANLCCIACVIVQWSQFVVYLPAQRILLLLLLRPKTITMILCTRQALLSPVPFTHYAAVNQLCEHPGKESKYRQQMTRARHFIGLKRLWRNTKMDSFTVF